MHMLSRIMFGALNLAARRGFAAQADLAPAAIAQGASTPAPLSAAKLAARRRGIRGETYAYWYLRRHGYIMIARNFTVAGIKGEIDLVGYDRDVLAFVEVKLRSIQSNEGAGTLPRQLPEDAVGPAKRRDLIRMARHFLALWRKHNGPFRFDILAIEARKGAPPVVRLHKDAFAMHI